MTRIQNVYLASQYARKEEMHKYADEFREWGINVTSRWLDEDFSSKMKMSDTTEQNLARFAGYDLEDITASDTMVFFAEPQENQPPRGGRHVEFGYALAQGVNIFVIGEPENIFHHRPEVKHYPHWEDFIAGEVSGL